MPNEKGGVKTKFYKTVDCFKTKDTSPFLLLHDDQRNALYRYFQETINDDFGPAASTSGSGSAQKKKKEKETAGAHSSQRSEPSPSNSKKGKSASLVEAAQDELIRRQRRETHPYTLHVRPLRFCTVK